MLSMRSAADVMAAATAACRLLLRSAVAACASCAAASSSCRLGNTQVHLAKLVGDGQRRHDGESCIADLAELGAQSLDAAVEFARETHQVSLLAVLAGHPELPPVNGDADLRHGRVGLTA